ncbi:MAG TPA: alkaline phosphatase PhoX, partial [Bryobacteraceae bacterium]|nr:alkaline phosphatase PhoX [Bryobacteraceae bacterium]
LAWEGLAILPNGTTYYGDELRPATGVAGGAIYKFVPTQPWAGGVATTPANSPYASGKIYGLRLGTSGTDYGQGSEVGVGRWVLIETAPDSNGNINLRAAAATNKLTGYYRPEDMDLDTMALARGIVRFCWANTGRMTNGGSSMTERGGNPGEILCGREIYAGDQVTESELMVTRLWGGDSDANYFDNVAFQPHTGNLVVLEDGEVETVTPDGRVELRGNDIWMLLPDGEDRDNLTDGAIKIASLRDTASEPSGAIFDPSGQNLYVCLQHRSTNRGAILKISGFHVPSELQ